MAISIFVSFDLAKLWLKAKQIKEYSKIHEVMEASSFFSPMDKEVARSKTNIERQRTYLWVGRLDANKDPLTLIKAFINFLNVAPNDKLYIIFNGDALLSEIENLRREHPQSFQNIFLIGGIAHMDMAYWFNSADFILSTSHYEGSGIAVCEGMSCGCIPILSDIHSFRMMTNEGQCGLLFTPGNVNSLELALVESTLLDISKERDKVLDQFNVNLSFKAIASKMLRVSEKLLKE